MVCPLLQKSVARCLDEEGFQSLNFFRLTYTLSFDDQSDWKSELFPSHLVAHHSVCKILKVSEFEIFGLFF